MHAFSLFLACALCGTVAHSAEYLRFDSGTPPHTLLGTLAEYAPGDAWDVSAIDLNDDGIDENILKTRSEFCDDTAGCQYIIAGRKQGEWIRLGGLKAFNILVSDRRTYGIRDLIVYNSTYNDFESVLYVWIYEVILVYFE